MAIPHISYTGSCQINDGINTTLIFCQSASVNIESKPTFYDHTVGLIESYLGFGSGGVAGSGGGNKIQKKYYRYSPTLSKASISGLLTQNTAPALLNWVRWGGTEPGGAGGTTTDDDGLGLVGLNTLDVQITMWENGMQKTLKSAYMQSLTIDVKAGDVVSFSAEFVGKSVAASSGQTSGSAGALDKLLTWDAVKVQVNNGSWGSGGSAGFTEFSSISLTVNNPIIPIYTANSANLNPFDLRIGMQDTTGSITTYGANSYLQGEADIVVDFGDGSGGSTGAFTFHAAFDPPSDKASANSIYLCSTNFIAFADSGRSW